MQICKSKRAFANFLRTCLSDQLSLSFVIKKVKVLVQHKVPNACVSEIIVLAYFKESLSVFILKHNVPNRGQKMLQTC